jgi:vacuolar-type H+-ATPase subunit D/Vma8
MSTVTETTTKAKRKRSTALEILETLKDKRNKLESRLITLNDKIEKIENRFRNRIVVDQMSQTMSTEDIERELEATKERIRLLREAKKVTAGN